MDLITGLPKTRSGHDAILVIVDRLTKYALFIPTTEGSEDKTKWAKHFVDRVVSVFGCPEEIVSDRGGHFTNEWWDCVCKLLGIHPSRSSAFHPESDGQTERMNKVLEEYLRGYVNERHKDWDKWLPTAQFAVNNSVHTGHEYTPHYLLFGEHPRTYNLSELPDVRVQRTAHEWVEHISEIVCDARTRLEAAQQRMTAYANRGRRDVSYAPGDLVLLSTKNLRPVVGVKKLLPKFVGPFEVKARVGPVAVRLALTGEYSRLHDVFHVSLVKPYRQRTVEDDRPAHRALGPELSVMPELQLHEIIGYASKPGKKGGERITKWNCRWNGKDERGDYVWYETWEDATHIPKEHPRVIEYREENGLDDTYYV